MIRAAARTKTEDLIAFADGHRGRRRERREA